MTTLRKAAKKALEALDRSDYFGWQSNIPIIKNLREALEQPEPEPVAWTNMSDANDWLFLSGRANPNGKLKGEWTALYTHPPQRKPEREPVAWAVYDIKHGGSKTLHWPEQHSPNGDPSQFKAVPLYSVPPQRKPQPEQEPVADTESDVLTATYMLGVHAGKKVAQRKPLTVEEIDQLSRTMVKGGKSVNWLCQAIERAHGIGEKE